MPTISVFFGITVAMFFNDHNPPHVHVRYQNYKATVAIESLKVTGNFPKAQTKLVKKWISLHTNALLSAWKRASEYGNPGKIPPLE